MSTFDPVAGSAREQFDLNTDSLDPRTASEDFRRCRAFYFDGRFLTARDLTREQQYTLIRQADLGQAGGGGVVSGLRVVRVNARTLLVGSGYGFTPGGEGLRLTRFRSIGVNDLPTIERLDATFGLAPLPGEPTGTASGLFVLALRPVEFTDNPTVSYPVGLDERRRLEAGEIIEGSALILIPFEKTGQDVVESESRADLARSIFLERGLRRLPGQVLALAVIALDRGNIAFVDEYLVRRNVGSTMVIGFGLGERAVREAYLLQYTAHLTDVEQNRRRQGQREPYAASEFFRALPPFGPLPAGCVEVRGDQILQSFFPPDMNVELTVVPRDELASLAEETLTFAPLDLEESSAALELTAVSILIPIDPEQYVQKAAQLGSPDRKQLEQRVTRPTSRVLPIAALDVLRRRRFRPPPVVVEPLDVAPWRDTLQAAAQLYYVRRRQVPQVSFVIPRFPEIGSTDPTNPNPAPQPWSQAVRQRLVSAGELSNGPALRRFDALVRRSSGAVVSALHGLFNRDIFDTANPARTEAALLINAAVAELAYRARTRLEDLVRADAFPESTLPGSVPPLRARGAPIRVRALRTEDVDALVARYGAAEPPPAPALGAGLRALLALGVVDVPDLGRHTNVGARLGALSSRSFLAASLKVRELDRAFARLPATPLDPLPRAAFGLRLVLYVEAGMLDGIWALAAELPPPPLPVVT